MAERRMFAKTIIDSDAFLDMPLSTQALYFHLSMRADDDGFVNNPKKVQRMIGASDDDIRILISKRYILTFDSGIIVIKHWKIHNYIQADRYKETTYLEEKAQLMLDEKKSYTECIQNVYNMDTQVSIGKNSIDYGYIKEKNIEKKSQDMVGFVDKNTSTVESTQHLQSISNSLNDNNIKEEKKVISKEKKSNIDNIINSRIEDEDIKNAIYDFIEMRKLIKKPMTDRAVTLMINDLNRLATDKETQIKIIEQSIKYNWQGLFALKEEKNTNSGSYQSRQYTKEQLNSQFDDIELGIML